jgi:ribosomal protein L14
MTTFVVKRSYGKNHDYLHAWCARWGTACMLSIQKALPFDTREAAEAAAVKAQAECKGRDGPAVGFTFAAVAV